MVFKDLKQMTDVELFWYLEGIVFKEKVTIASQWLLKTILQMKFRYSNDVLIEYPQQIFWHTHLNSRENASTSIHPKIFQANSELSKERWVDKTLQSTTEGFLGIIEEVSLNF